MRARGERQGRERGSRGEPDAAAYVHDAGGSFHVNDRRQKAVDEAEERSQKDVGRRVANGHGVE